MLAACDRRRTGARLAPSLMLDKCSVPTTRPINPTIIRSRHPPPPRPTFAHAILPVPRQRGVPGEDARLAVPGPQPRENTNPAPAAGGGEQVGWEAGKGGGGGEKRSHGLLASCTPHGHFPSPSSAVGPRRRSGSGTSTPAPSSWKLRPFTRTSGQCPRPPSFPAPVGPRSVARRPVLAFHFFDQAFWRHDNQLLISVLPFALYPLFCGSALFRSECEIWCN